MKPLIRAAAMGVVLVGGALPSYAQPPGPISSLDPSMTLQNMSGPFVDQAFAKRLALLVVEEKYPRATLFAKGVKKVMDRGGTWWVTVEVGVPHGSPLARLGRPLLPQQLTIQIRKTNAEVVSIS